jgi:chemotaxis protein CheD
MAEDTQRRELYLVPGALHAAPEPFAVTTILGSCVAVCLTDSTRGVGGINHFALPGRPGQDESPRFGHFAVQRLIDALLALGSRRETLQAKIFGGACVNGHAENWSARLGAQNVAVAREVLAAADIPVIAEDVEGFRGRKVIYYTDNGTAWVRRL